MQACVKAIRYVRRGFFVVSAAFIAVASALAAVNAILRFMGIGFGWADELYIYLVVLMVYLALPQLEGTGDQLCISAIDSWVKGKVGKKVINYFRQLVTGAALVTLAYYGLQVMIKAFSRNQLTYILMLPKGILYAIAVLSIVVAVIVILIIMICNKGEFDDVA